MKSFTKDNRTYTPKWISEYFAYDATMQHSCFKCVCVFAPGDTTYLAHLGQYNNQLLCAACAEELQEQ